MLVISVSLPLSASEKNQMLPSGELLTMARAINIAHHNDPWLSGNALRQQSLDSQSIASATLPDPMVSVGLANLPVDGFDFNQEGMTQFKVGIAQRFPRGDSLALQQKRLATQSSQHPLLGENRKARVAVTVAQLWLEAFRAQKSIELIENDRELFEHLVDVVQLSYSSALGRTRQQDLVRAQLELTRLEDRLTLLHQQQEAALSRLREWLGPELSANSVTWGHSNFTLPDVLPTIELKYPALFEDQSTFQPQRFMPYLKAHPAIKSLDQKINASSLGIELAKQKYKPQWGVNASYGYRGDDPMGNSRADFFSVGVTFDLPIFTSNRQDKMVQSAIADTEAVKTEKWLALRKMLATLETDSARLARLDQRLYLYHSRLLQEMHEQAEASLTAYTNDDGDFSEVVRARIAELNARIDVLKIEIDRLKTVVNLNYFFTQNPSQTDNKSAGETL
jgi:outer membrane protein TolC